MTDLGSLGGNQTWAAAINNNGWIIGSGYTDTGELQAILWAHIPEPASLLFLGLGGLLIRKNSKKICIPRHIWYSIGNEA